MSIVINRSYNLGTGDGPYDYTWSVNKSTVTLDNVSGTVAATNTGNFTTQFTFASEADFSGLSVVLNVTGKSGCTASADFTSDFPNPCSGWVVSQINRNNLTFSVTSTKSATYQWFYDSDLFEALNPTNEPQLKLSIDSNPLDGNTTNISLIVTSDEGCIETRSFTYTFDQPLAQDVLFTDLCGNLQESLIRRVFLSDYITSTYPIDWTTLEVTDQDNTNTVILEDGEISMARFGPLTGSEVNILYYKVKDINGNLSNQGRITWKIVCKSIEVFTDAYVEINNTVNTTDSITLPVSYSNNVDHAKTKFIPLTSFGQSVDITERELTTPNGTAGFDADNNITYLQTDATPTGAGDFIQFQVFSAASPTTPSKESRIIQTGITFNQIAAPNATAHGIAVHENDFSSFVDLASGGSSDIDRSTLEITSQSTGTGSIETTNDGYIRYRPTGSVLGINLTGFTYRFKNNSGVYSPTAQGYLAIDKKPVLASAQVYTACIGTSFDLREVLSIYSLLSNGGVFTETTDGTTYASQGGTITSPSGVGAVDFSATGIANGNYTFRYSVITEGTQAGTIWNDNPATSSVDFTVTKMDSVSLTIDTTTPVATNGSNINYRFDFTVIGGTGPAGLTTTINSVDAVYVTPPSINGTAGSFVITLASGVSNTVAMQMTTICGGTTSDATSITP